MFYMSKPRCTPGKTQCFTENPNQQATQTLLFHQTIHFCQVMLLRSEHEKGGSDISRPEECRSGLQFQLDMGPASPEPRERHWNSTEMDDIFVHISDGHSFIISLKGTPSLCNFFGYIHLFPNKIFLVDFISFYILFCLLFLTAKSMSHLFYWTMKSLRWEIFLSGIYFQLLLKYENIKRLSIKILKYSVN